MDERVSVIIPAYNEAAVIGHTVEMICASLTASQIPHEIIVVDDGSTDRTRDIVRDRAAANPTVRLLEGGHLGKGGAIKQGMLAAKGRYALFLDADYSTRIDEFQRCLPWLRDGYDVVIGSRKIPGATVAVHQPWLRELMGKGFTWLTNALLGVGVSDFTCGFKCFQAEAAQHIFRLQRVDGWGFDAEILFIARRAGYRIKEVPVAWANDVRTKVRLVKDTVRSFRELLMVRLGAWRGWYPRQKS